MVVERIGCPTERTEFKRLMGELKSHIVVIKCYADWCGPCSNIKEELEKEFDSIRSTDKVMMYLDVEEQRDVASYLQIKALPTIISYRDGMKENIIEGSEREKIRYFFRNIRRK